MQTLASHLHRRVSLLASAAALFGAAGYGCSASKHDPEDAAVVRADSGTTEDAAIDAGVDVDADPILVALASDTVDAYNRQVMTNCPCYVEMGAYKSVEECVSFTGSGPDWVRCAAGWLTTHDTPELRAQIQCYSDLLKSNNDCLMMAACDADERAKCDQSPLQCFADGAALPLAVECPDISLLPRL
jgi:hypothetical protein